MLEVDGGTWRITYKPKKPLPVGEFLSTQGRFAHLSEEQIALVQQHVDDRWDLLGRLEAATAKAET